MVIGGHSGAAGKVPLLPLPELLDSCSRAMRRGQERPETLVSVQGQGPRALPSRMPGRGLSPGSMGLWRAGEWRYVDSVKAWTPHGYLRKQPFSSGQSLPGRWRRMVTQRWLFMAWLLRTRMKAVSCGFWGPHQMPPRLWLVSGISADGHPCLWALSTSAWPQRSMCL